MKNLEGEAEAIEGYFRLLENYPDMEREDRQVIEEIISDEQNHSIKLIRLGLKYGNIRISPDGMASTLNFIVENIDDGS